MPNPPKAGSIEMRPEYRRPRGSFRLYILVGLLVSLCFCTNFLLLKGDSTLENLGYFLVVDDGDVQPADLIHVLGGRPERLDFGIQLYKAGYAPRLFITGGIEDVVRYRRYAVEQGVPPEAIFPKESQAVTTYQEALQLKLFLDQEPHIQSVVIVSSPYHMRRSQLIFDWLLRDRVSRQFIPVPFELSEHRPVWWANKSTRDIVFSEYLKILALPVAWYETPEDFGR
jgi:uncharacterized SAM-binding protein YcdF (DUF218 family)